MYYVKLYFDAIMDGNVKTFSYDMDKVQKIVNTYLPDHMLFLLNEDDYKLLPSTQFPAMPSILEVDKDGEPMPITKTISGYIAIDPNKYSISSDSKFSNLEDIKIIIKYFTESYNINDNILEDVGNKWKKTTLTRFENTLFCEGLISEVRFADIKKLQDAMKEITMPFNDRTNVITKKYPKLLYMGGIEQVDLNEFMKCCRTKIYSPTFSSSLNIWNKEIDNIRFLTDIKYTRSHMSTDQWYREYKHAMMELCGDKKSYIIGLLMDQFAFVSYSNTVLYHYDTSNFKLDYWWHDVNASKNYNLIKENINKVRREIRNKNKPITFLSKFYARGLNEVKYILNNIFDANNNLPSETVNVVSIMGLYNNLSEINSYYDSNTGVLDKIEMYLNSVETYLKGSTLILRIPGLNQEMEYIDEGELYTNKQNSRFYKNSKIEGIKTKTSSNNKNNYTRRRLYNQLDIKPDIFDNSCLAKIGDVEVLETLNDSINFSEFNASEKDYESISRFINIINSPIEESFVKYFKQSLSVLLQSLSASCNLFIWYEDTIPYNNNFLLPDNLIPLPLSQSNPFKTKSKVKDFAFKTLNDIDMNNGEINKYKIKALCNNTKIIDFLFYCIKLSPSNYGSLLGSKSLVANIFKMFNNIEYKNWDSEIDKMLKEAKKALSSKIPLELNLKTKIDTEKEKLKLSLNENNVGFIHENIDDLIGLDSVKKILKNYTAFVSMNKYKQDHGINTSNKFSKHMCFLGNPGTCKTTVAKLLAIELYKIGIIKIPSVRVVSRSDLIERYVGWTAKNVEEIVNSSLGGILFIDEAYSLLDNNDSSYGTEAINTLVSLMDEERIRNNLIIIFAGYPEDMNKLLKSNSGLPSRISTIVEFPNYNKEELLKISNKLSKDMSIELTDGFISKLKESIDKYSNRKDFGNGRFIRSVLEKSMIKQSYRLFNDTDKLKTDPTKDQLIKLLDVDFDDSNIFANNKNSKNFKNSIGFNIR